MKQTRALKLNIVEGNHAGHNVVVDAYGIDVRGRDPETAAWCHDCKEELEVYEIKGEKDNHAND